MGKDIEVVRVKADSARKLQKELEKACNKLVNKGYEIISVDPFTKAALAFGSMHQAMITAKRVGD